MALRRRIGLQNHRNAVAQASIFIARDGAGLSAVFSRRRSVLTVARRRLRAGARHRSASRSPAYAPASSLSTPSRHIALAGARSRHFLGR